jgi:cholesterol transport system auxiliary component
MAPAGKMQLKTLGQRTARFGLVAGLATSLSACALLGISEKPRETYELSAVDGFSGLSAATRAQILVKAPSALKSLDSERIVVRPAPPVVTYLAGAQWSDTLPRMVQAKLVATFENTGRTGATAQPGDGLVIDFQLVSEIRRFGIDERTGTAQIEMSIKLLTDKSGRVRQTRIFREAVPVRGSTSDAYFAALDDAFDLMTRDIVQWVLRTI